MNSAPNQDVLDKLLLLYYWERPEYTNAWRLCFEEKENKRKLLIKVLGCLPASLGHLDFLEDFPSEQFVVLFTHNPDNDAARKNEARILTVLTGTTALMLFGVEGAFGNIEMDWYRNYPHQDSVRAVAEYLFRERRVSPLVAVMFYSRLPVVAWGIEDPDLYEAARTSLSYGKNDYWQLIRKRSPLLFVNLRKLIEERCELYAGATLTDYNYWEGHAILKKEGIAHAGISAAETGPTVFGRSVGEIKKQKLSPTDLDKLFMGEMNEKEALENREIKRLEYNKWKEGRSNPST